MKRLIFAIAIILGMTFQVMTYYNFDNGIQTNSFNTQEKQKIDHVNYDEENSNYQSEEKILSNSENEEESFEVFNNTKTVITANNTYVNTGGALNLTINSSEWSVVDINNTYSYKISSPINQTPIFVNRSIVNQTLKTESYNWEGQNLDTTHESNFTSYFVFPDELTVTNITNVLTVTNPSPTSAIITWITDGKSNSWVSYGTNKTDLKFNTSVDEFTTFHKVYLTNLDNETTFYYQLNSTDIFGNMVFANNNGSTYSFTTPEVTIGRPIIKDVEISSFTTNSAWITFNTNIDSNATIHYGESKNNLEPSTTKTGNNFLFQITTNIDQATQYFFYINATSFGNTTIDNNAGRYFQFTTLPDSNDPLDSVNISFNNSHAQINLTTNQLVHSEISYTSSPDLVSFSSTDIVLNKTNHVHYVPIDQVTWYYFKIQLTNATGIETWTYTQNSSYYTFYTEPQKTKQVNEAVIEITFQIPSYPAILGNWQFSLSIYQNHTIENETTILDGYQFSFLVNSTLNFNSLSTLVERGTWANETDMFPNWIRDEVNTSLTSIFSPGDNLAFLGTLAYENSQENLNSSLIPFSGSILLNYQGNKLSGPSGLIRGIKNPTYNINQSFLDDSGLDNTTTALFGFKIPNLDIYGEITLSLVLKFPGNMSYSILGYEHEQEFLNLTVQYRLAVEEHSGKDNYVLTESDVIGSVTIIPYHWKNVVNINPSIENVTNELSIPSDEINVSVHTFTNSEEVQLFEVKQVDYTWYWKRDRLESSINTGDYIIRLNWTDGSRLPIPKTEVVYDDNPSAFIYNFSIDVSFMIKDLTSTLPVMPTEDSAVTLRFKVVVVETGIAWDQEFDLLVATEISGITLDGVAIFDILTGEYRQNVTISGLDVGDYNLTVSGITFVGNNVITVHVIDETSITIPPVDTESVIEKSPSLIDIGIIGLASLGGILYIGIVILFFRRK
ncbi:MAG: fibronectin type III domain-containing protein [Candidatus Hodarchaeales archaeon]|jgi:hypothetical protein